MTENSLFSLDSLQARHPEIGQLSDCGRCDRCGSLTDVFDLPLLLVLSARGLLKCEKTETSPRYRLRQSNWVDEHRRPLSMAGILAAMSEPAKGGLGSILAIGLS